MFFLELTLADGRKLDIPAAAVSLAESLDPSAKEKNPGARSGVIYDLGQGVETAFVKEPYGKISKRVRAAASLPWFELETAFNQRLMMLVHNVVSICDMEPHPDTPRAARIMHKVGDRMMPLDVIETRDEIRALMARALPQPPAPQEIEADGEGIHDQADE